MPSETLTEEERIIDNQDRTIEQLRGEVLELACAYVDIDHEVKRLLIKLDSADFVEINENISCLRALVFR